MFRRIMEKNVEELIGITAGSCTSQTIRLPAPAPIFSSDVNCRQVEYLR